MQRIHLQLGVFTKLQKPYQNRPQNGIIVSYRK